MSAPHGRMAAHGRSVGLNAHVVVVWALNQERQRMCRGMLSPITLQNTKVTRVVVVVANAHYELGADMNDTAKPKSASACCLDHMGQNPFDSMSLQLMCCCS